MRKKKKKKKKKTPKAITVTIMLDENAVYTLHTTHLGFWRRSQAMQNLSHDLDVASTSCAPPPSRE